MAQSSLLTLVAQAREDVGTSAAKRLRRTGSVPAVLYGHGRGTVNLSVEARVLAHAVDHGVQVLALETPAGVEQALIKDLQYDVYHQHVLHVDFARIALDEAVSVEVPIELHGEVDEGTVDQTLHVLPVTCRADRIPEKIRVEVGGLTVGQVFDVGGLDLPEGVTPQVPPETVVVTVHALRVEEEEVEGAPAEAAEGAEPEVIGEKAEEGEEAPEQGSSSE